MHVPDWQSGVGCAHAGWLCQEPVASHVCGVEPEQRVAFGEHAPVQSPSPLQMYGHVCVVCQVPVVSHVCLDAPEHCVWLGTHFPVHAPRVQPKGQVCVLRHLPSGPQVWTPVPAHCFEPGSHARAASAPPPVVASLGTPPSVSLS
jgi:hypothetical protein